MKKEEKDILGIFKARIKQKIREEYQIHSIQRRLDSFTRNRAHNENLVEIVDGGLAIHLPTTTIQNRGIQELMIL